MFCHEYIVDLNATQAAIRAGYSAKTADVIGCENLVKPNIQQYIQKLMDKRSEKVNINANDILKSIIEVRERCMEKKPVMYKVDGEYVQESVAVMNEDGKVTEHDVWKFDPSNALKANELLGKHLKLFTDKVEHSGEIKMPSIEIIKPKK